MSIISDNLSDLDKAIEHFQEDIAVLKTGRANPAILDNIRVDAYGVLTPLNQLSSISVPEARSIIIQPWDKNVIKAMEKAVREAGLDLGIANEGDRIRITVPQMTEESRREIVKLLGQKEEQARIAVRNIREDIKEKILAAEKNKEFGEDEKFSLVEELDKTVSDYNNKIKEISQAKEQEIMTV
ncbi:MAG TPA: ribosome recycling factor [bacterium]|nr:ribosome recycling factor [bacterium]HPN81585.1 ribosome recycling factor [bacterium]HPW39719.1 ribosome recycling factor [bacterium]